MQQGQRPTEVPVSDGLRVLIVEEIAVAAELAVRQLVQGGITCTYLQVAAEKDFRAALLRFAPQLILSDLVLPRLDGLTALEIARRELPDVPFIFLSSTPGEERAVEAMRHGAADYVLKANASRLVPAVLSALREVGARTRLRTREQQIKDKERRRHDQQQ
jgi:CheY-like chemotaxis protein